MQIGIDLGASKLEYVLLDDNALLDDPLIKAEDESDGLKFKWDASKVNSKDNTEFWYKSNMQDD